METKENNYLSELKKWILQFILCGLAFFVVALPCRKLFVGIQVTEVSPASAFPPIFGMMFGSSAVLGCTVANFFVDLFTRKSPEICFFGIFIQFLYGFIPYILWKIFTKKNNDDDYRMNSSRKFVYFLVCMLASCVITSLLNGLLIKFVEYEKLFSSQTLFVFLNNIVFSYFLGLPIFISYSFIKQQQINKANTESKVIQFSLSEKFLLIFIIIGILVSVCVGAIVCSLSKELYGDPLALWNRVYIFMDSMLILFILLALVLMFYLEKSIMHPLSKMIEVGKKYAENPDAVLNSDYVVDKCNEYTSQMTEIGELARAFVYITRDMENHVKNLNSVKDEKDIYRKEITFANQIQKTLTPQLFPAFINSDKVDVYASIEFSTDFSGDFYDYFMIDDKHLAIVMADVSGKGVSAALYMAITRTLIKDKILEGLLPEEVFAEINTQLAKDNKNNLFVAAWFGLLDLETGKISYVNAGMTSPLVSRDGNDFEFIEDSREFVLAISDETLYASNELQLNGGDKLILYTKGITEAKNITNQSYGKGNLLSFINHNKHHSSENLVAGLQRDISIFVGDIHPSDDLTMLVLEYKK